MPSVEPMAIINLPRIQGSAGVVVLQRTLNFKKSPAFVFQNIPFLSTGVSFKAYASIPYTLTSVLREPFR